MNKQLHTAVKLLLPLCFFCLSLVMSNTPGSPALAEGYPQRIVSLGPINTENVFLLGAGDRLVGNTEYCIRPPAARQVSKVGSVMEVSIEKILSLKPDLILATGLTRSQQTKKLRDLGMHVVQFNKPKSFAEICNHFLELGHLLGLSDTAEEIVQHLQVEVNALSARLAHFPSPKVLLQVGADPLYASGRDSFMHDYIILSGGINIAGSQPSAITSREMVLAEDPDVIIIAMMGGQAGLAGKERQKWYSYRYLKAAQQNRIHIFSPDLACSPSPATFVQALKEISTLIHPKIGNTK